MVQSEITNVFSPEDKGCSQSLIKKELFFDILLLLIGVNNLGKSCSSCSQWVFHG
jgi:hypothetical protein